MVRIVKKAEVRRAEIVQAARHLFQAKEYEKTTMQDVMERLEIAKGTIYHHFQSKEELLEAVVENIVAERVEQMQHRMDEAQGSALDKLRILVQAGNMESENAEILATLHHTGNVAMHTRLLAVALTRQAPLYAKVISQGCAEGLFETEYPLECAEFILSALQFLTDTGIHPWTQEDLLRRAVAFPRLIETQLKAPQGSFQFLFQGF
jgi:AcrR family transcriptional regulator